jgi:hypothetical protein
MHHLIRATIFVAALAMPTAGIAAHHPAGVGTSGARLAQMCDAGSRDIAGLPIEQIRRSIQPDGDKRAALDELAGATKKAAQDLKAACPAETPPTAPGRLAAMQVRIEAMIAAVATVRPPLEKFYGLLSDEQKEQVTTLSQSQRRGASLLEDCGATQLGPAEWPTADIERRVRPTEAQRASLTALQDAAAKAAEIVKGSCPTESPFTPTARLAAIATRLDALLQSVKTMSGPLNDCYGMLDDAQKARFDAISLPRTSQTEQPRAKPPHRHHYVSLGAYIRRLFHLF